MYSILLQNVTSWFYHIICIKNSLKWTKKCVNNFLSLIFSKNCNLSLTFSVVVGEEKKKEMIAVHLTFSNSVEECNFAFFRFKKDEEEAAREL